MYGGLSSDHHDYKHMFATPGGSSVGDEQVSLLVGISSTPRLDSYVCTGAGRAVCKSCFVPWKSFMRELLIDFSTYNSVLDLLFTNCDNICARFVWIMLIS